MKKEQIKQNSQKSNFNQLQIESCESLKSKGQIVGLVLQILSMLTIKREFAKLIFETEKVHSFFQLLNFESDFPLFFLYLAIIFGDLIQHDFSHEQGHISISAKMFQGLLFKDYFPFIHYKLNVLIEREYDQYNKNLYFKELLFLHSSFLETYEKKYKFIKVRFFQG
jgi:hypothetical protein